MFKFLGNFFKKIGMIFQNLAASVEKVWKHYEPALQNAIKDGSGIVQVINDNVEQTPDFVFSLLEQKFPNLTKDQITGLLKKVSDDLNLAKGTLDEDILTTLQNVMNYLKSHTGGNWAKASEFIANTIALFLAPEGTLWNKIGTVMWWVYQTFIKKDK